jgi:hypothetical protein
MLERTLKPFGIRFHSVRVSAKSWYAGGCGMGP